MHVALLSLGCNRDWRRIEVYLGSIVPSDVIVPERGEVIARCGSLSPVEWSYSPRRLLRDNFRPPVSRRHRRGHKMIKLTKLTVRDSGFYYCHGTTNESSFQNSLMVTVTNEVPDEIVSPSRVEVSRGKSVTLTCGSVKPVEWISVNYYQQKKSIADNSLILHRLQKKDSGLYYCRGLDGFWNRIFHTSATIIVDGYVKHMNTIH